MSDHVWYFSYGLNMSLRVLAERGIVPLKSEVASVPRMRLVFEMKSIYRPGSGDATIVPQNKNERVPNVWGLLHLVTSSDIAARLDKWEAVDSGHYRRIDIPALCYSGKQVTAQTYVACHLDRCLRPDHNYLITMIEAAKDNGFPKEYISFLNNYRGRELC